MKEKPGNNKKKFDLQDRFVDYSVSVIKISQILPNTKAGNHICTQILRSGTSPAANYGEAQGAESRPDFIHKLKLVLKELRETEVWLKVIAKSEMVQPISKLSQLLKETNELISIIFKSIETSKRKLNNERK